MHAITKVEPHDLISLTKLVYETLPERYSPLLFTQLYETTPDSFLLAKFGQRIIGYIIGIKTEVGVMRILMLGVDKQFRRNRVATELLNRFLTNQIGLQIHRIELEVQTSNIPAISFYNKLGFTIKEQVPSFYQNGEDAYIMQLWLQTY
ncbi:MAG: GNAT family N-acetyltransferase [Candidatus Thermoplasmatota archaeon]|nr:GNAT family N-acetyltransferase [Candidatus Thermoplasmatota archaeon]MBU1940409.1 GNAT family N-acetyltransferase [Candidatus Thermoplasmatota archaeon]